MRPVAAVGRGLVLNESLRAIPLPGNSVFSSPEILFRTGYRPHEDHWAARRRDVGNKDAIVLAAGHIALHGTGTYAGQLGAKIDKASGRDAPLALRPLPRSAVGTHETQPGHRGTSAAVDS